MVLGCDLSEAAMCGAVAEEKEERLGAGIKRREGLGFPAEDGSVEGADAVEIDGGDFGPCYSVVLSSSVGLEVQGKGGWEGEVLLSWRMLPLCWVWKTF